MQKKLFAVLLALCLVLVFSSLALAADFNVNAAVASGKTVELVKSDNTYTYYTDADQVALDFTPETGVTLDGPENNHLTLSGSTPVTVTANKSGAYPVDYTFKMAKLSDIKVTIEADLYDAKDGAAYSTSGSNILVPSNASPYAKITVEGIDPGKLSFSGAGSPDADGFTKLDAINEKTESAAITVKLGSTQVGYKKFALLRPTLDTIEFNGKPEVNGKRTLTANKEAGDYTYDTKDQVKSSWDPLYYRINPVSEEAEVSVKRASATPNPSNGWYTQDMSQAPYKLTVTISLTGDDDKVVSQKYYIYLMNEDYSGPYVKTFEANEKSGGKGDEYLTVVDNEGKTVYIFLPKDADGFYVDLTMNGSVEDLTLAGGEIEEGEWTDELTAADLDGKTLKFKDAAGIEYSYQIKVDDTADDRDIDASLKSLTVRSGSKSSTADDVDIDFDPKVLDYAFPVTKDDVYLKLTAAAKSAKATVFINNEPTATLTETALDTAAVTEFEILVVAGDNKTTQTYTVTVNGSTGLLQTLTVSNTNGLTPAFGTEINTYTACTDVDTASSLITAITKNYSSDYVQISKANFNKYGQASSYTALTRVTAGGAKVTAELTAGSNIFRVDVLGSATATSAKGSYYISIYVPTADPTCKVSSQKLYVNGKAQTLSAYNIAGNNFLKLRDIAALLDGTVKEVKVDWDESKWTASLTMPGTFAKRGDELTTLSSPKKYAITTQYFTYNTKPVHPMAYAVTGTDDTAASNYVMLRDIASLLDFGVTYDGATQTIHIDTASEYTPGL